MSVSATSVPAAAGADHPPLRWTDLPWHPILFALTFVLDYWVRTAVSPFSAARSVVIAVAIGAALILVAWILLRDLRKAGLLATLVLLVLYSKVVVDVFVEVAGHAPVVTVAWLAALVLAVALVVRLVRRRTGTWSFARLNRVLNMVAAVYLVATIALGAVAGRFGTAVRDLDQGMPLADAVAGSDEDVDDAVDAPDIYVILLDGYPRADVLMEAFGYDNSVFTDALEERGFTLADGSHTEYLWTQHSLTSMLHMQPAEEVPDFQGVLDGTVPRHPTLRDIVNFNPVFDTARDAGYEVAAVGYEFDQVALRQADVYADAPFMNEFELNLLISTYLGDLVNLVAPDFASSQHRAWIEFQLETLPEIAAADLHHPRLVFGHLSAPHQPAVYGPDGEARTVTMDEHFYADSPAERGEDPDAFAQRYRDQLTYLNRRYLELVDRIIAASPEPPVIVLWGDHGSASQVDWNNTLSEDADPADLRERTATLFAALTPDGDAPFPDDIQPHDIFRVLADTYLGTNLGRWPGEEGSANGS